MRALFIAASVQYKPHIDRDGHVPPAAAFGLLQFCPHLLPCALVARDRHTHYQQRR